MHTILSRQIDLDFHTAGNIPNVGGAFDKVQFQEALQVAHVNWINIFAKCHHGYSYYPTNVGVQNPCAVTDNLLGKQIEACREIGVRPISYITVGWSSCDSNAHPEWTTRLEAGEKSIYAPIVCTAQEWISGSEQRKTSALRYNMHS